MAELLVQRASVRPSIHTPGQKVAGYENPGDDHLYITLFSCSERNVRRFAVLIKT